MAYEPIGRRGIYTGETVTLGDGSRYTWIPTRDRWELSGGTAYNERANTSPNQAYQNALASGATEAEAQAEREEQVNRLTNPGQNNLFGDTIVTGLGVTTTDTQRSQDIQDTYERLDQIGALPQTAQEYFKKHIDFTIQVSASPNLGSLVEEGGDGNVTWRTKGYNSNIFETGGRRYYFENADGVKSSEYYRLVANQKTREVEGRSEPYWCISREYYRDGSLVGVTDFDNDGDVVQLGFDLSKWIVTPPTPVPGKTPVEVDIPDDLVGKFNYSFAGQSGTLQNFGGDELHAVNVAGTDFSFNVSSTENLSDWNVTFELFKNGSSLGKSYGENHTFNLSETELGYKIVVSAVKQSAPIDAPYITVGNDVFSFDLANNSIEIPYRTFNTDSVNVTLGSIKRTVGPNDGVVIFTKSDFTRVGQYQLYLQPVSTLGGSGDAKRIIINVSNAVSLDGPDIRTINYPQEIKGADFKGYDVSFNVGWSSVNTNWVDVFVGKVSESTKLVSNRPAQGNLTLNVRDVLTKGGINVDDGRDITTFKLLFIPYNTQTGRTVSGKTEEISIRFDKGDLKLRRGNVVKDIRESISRLFDIEVLKPETSMNLTHLLHLGEGENKLISAWGTDTETFSEYTVDPQTGNERKTKEVKSLVLKLYEPLGTGVQPNQQVWVSKIQSIPLIEQMTVIEETVEECTPLQPNFNVSFTDNVGLQIYDDLISSGSASSTNIINQFVSGSGFNLKDLDIQFVSSSTTLIEFDNGGKLIETAEDVDYYWENFVKYSSAEERVENYIYKINTIDFYLNRLNLVTSGSHYQSSIALQKEKENIEFKINDIKANFDAFEDYLYTNEITSSTEGGYSSWYGGIIESAQEYDYNNTSRLTYNLPQHIIDDKNNAEFVLFFDMIGQHFDTLYLYNREIARSKKLEHKHQSGLIDKLIYQMLESLGWDADLGVKSQALWDYAFGTEADGTQTASMSGKERQNETWRRILNNLPYLLKTKGTKRAIHALLSCYGIPASMLTVMEFGGPRDTTKGGTTSFTYEDRTAAINLSDTAAITIPWKQYEGDYPNTVEVRLNTTTRQEQKIVSGDNWSLDILTDTGSRGKVQLTVGAVSTSIQPLPIFDDEYYHIAVTRENGTDFTLYVKQGFQDRIRNEESATLTAISSDWESGNSIQFGSSTLNASIDEIRLWSTPLIETVIENHTLLPDAINGNHNSASSEDLIFRNDFEYPKDRNSDVDIKNVALIQTYAISSVASGFSTAESYPYQYTPYDRTVTAQVPQAGFNYSNKFRFEDQYESNGNTILTATSSIDLSHRQRSTKRSFDKSPIDSNKLGLFFSPIKEVNMDILRSVGPINVDDFIGDPSDDYNYTYSSLDNFREYYFQRYNLNFNEYVQMVRYIERGLFDQLESLAPSRAKVAKGLLFEPHILERSKTQWNKPAGEENYKEVTIDTQEDVVVTSTETNHLALVSASEDTKLSTEQPFYEGIYVDGDPTLVSEKNDFEGTYVSTDDTQQIGEIVRNSEATMGGFEFEIEAVLTASIDTFYVNSSFTQVGGFGPNDLAVAGFGLYGSGSHAIRTRLVNGNIVKDRVKVFRFDEEYTEYQRENLDYNDPSRGTNIVEVTKIDRKVTILPFGGNDLEEGGKITNVIPLNGTFSTHYRLVEDLTTGMENSFFNGSKQTEATTLDGGPAVVTFTTNPNTLKVSDTGRGSGEPILEVE
jgi:hypothetical protein